MLYSDYDLLTIVQGKILFEGQPYYLDVGNHSDFVLKKWFENENIESAIQNYHPKNKILVLRFDNIVGYVNILGTEYDVRSKKLFDGLSGNDQFQSLLNEVSSLYSKLSFNHSGTSTARRENKNVYNIDELDVFDYYYQLAFLFPQNLNLDILIGQCIKSPNSMNVEIQIDVKFEKSKKLSPQFYRNIGNVKSLVKISDSHSLASSAFPKMTNRKIFKRLLPVFVKDTSNAQTTNTMENRFLKYFLEEINSLCIRIINRKVDLVLVEKAKRLQKKVTSYLLNPFFKNIQRLTFIPSSSAVLLKKSGYRDIYHHFVQSKFAFKPILDNHKKYALRYGLKNIASLYELWVFIKIARLIFGETLISEIFAGQVLKNGAMIGSYKWISNNIELSFNKSYTRKNGGSYSVTLRPDISLMISGRLFLFDAKYKFNSSGDETEYLLRVVKPEDIHKMHAYLDAINLAQSAIVVYPGTQVIFHEKEALPKDGILFSSGVGAIPLLPNNDQELSYIINGFKNELI